MNLAARMEPKLRLALLIALWCGFSSYSVAIVVGHGVDGIADLFSGDPWKAQVFFDLCILLGLFLGWMAKDARRHGIPPLPYLLLAGLTGSVGALAYLIHRTCKQVRGTASAGPPIGHSECSGPDTEKGPPLCR